MCISILITLGRAALMLTALGLIISSNRGDGPDMSRSGHIDPHGYSEGLRGAGGAIGVLHFFNLLLNLGASIFVSVSLSCMRGPAAAWLNITPCRVASKLHRQLFVMWAVLRVASGTCELIFIAAALMSIRDVNQANAYVRRLHHSVRSREVVMMSTLALARIHILVHML